MHRFPRRALRAPLPPDRGGPASRCAAAAAAMFGLVLSIAAQGGIAAQGTHTVTTIDGRTLTGSLSIDEAGKAVLVPAAGDPVELAFDMLTTIEQVTPTTGLVAAPHRVWLRSGNELVATRIAGRAAEPGRPAMLAVTLPAGVVVELPMSTVAALRFEQPAVGVGSTYAVDRATPSDNSDYLFIVEDGKSQRFSVTVNHFDDTKVHFDLRGKSYDFELANVLGIVFGRNSGFAANRQPNPRITAELSSGERLEGRLLELRERFRLRLDEGAVVDLPRERFVRGTVTTDRLVWLGQLQPKVEQTPAFDRVWPWTVDRSPAGAGILLAGKRYDRGLVLVPRTRLMFQLGGRYDRFEAMIGIDDRGGPQAHAIFRVLVDDKLVFESEPMTLGREPQPLRVPVTGGQQLALEVDFGKNYDLGDLCAFADARLLRQ